jgi:16S rRNA processing protein RimM
MLPPLINIGYIKKTFGYKGDVCVNLKDDVMDSLGKCEFVFINIDGYHIPYHLEGIDEKSDVILKLEGINTIDEAQYIVGSNVFVEESIFSKDDLEKLYLITDSIIGYKLMSDNLDIGIINKVDQLPTQLLAHVKNAEKTYLIPIVEEFLQKIDFQRKIIYLNLPEGILNL